MSPLLQEANLTPLQLGSIALLEIARFSRKFGRKTIDGFAVQIRQNLLTESRIERLEEGGRIVFWVGDATDATASCWRCGSRRGRCSSLLTAPHFGLGVVVRALYLAANVGW